MSGHETPSHGDGHDIERRDFGKLVLAGAIGGSALASCTTTRTYGKRNVWTDTGRHVGVSHQRTNMLNDAHLNYLKQMGCEYLEVRIRSGEATYDEIVRIKRTVEDAGLKLFEIMLTDKYNSHAFALGREDRDADIEIFTTFLKNLGKAGIDATTYAWHTSMI